jgi:diadenosine tetraphosphatase ApaH/serine/threonine PP2A family protein phosphatase
VALWLRKCTWITEETAERLGAELRGGFHGYFGDTNLAFSLAAAMQSVYFAAQDQVVRCDGLVRGLTEDRPIAVVGGDSGDTPFAVLADIHANRPALERVLDRLDAMNIRSGIVLGDTVGYGPHPAECIELLQKHGGFTVIKGNHDNGVVTGELRKGFSQSGRWVAEWTRNQLNEQLLEWLRSLPLYIRREDWLAVHGSPCDETFFNSYVYRMTYPENLDRLERDEIPICFHGHSHIAGIYSRYGGKETFCDPAHSRIRNDETVLICPGSVGQPRSGNPGTEFGVYDPKEREMKFYRLDYDIAMVAADMQKLGFPQQLVDRLRRGE